MSGAAGLSAARRRRAGGAGTVTTQSQNQVQQQQVTQTRGRITVQSILENHELRLREIEPRLRTLIDSDESVGGVSGLQVDQSVLDSVSSNSTTVAELTSSIAKLQASIGDIQATVLRLTNKVAELASTGVQAADVAAEVASDDNSSVQAVTGDNVDGTESAETVASSGDVGETSEE